jgi:hypothetical protein
LISDYAEIKTDNLAKELLQIEGDKLDTILKSISEKKQK